MLTEKEFLEISKNQKVKIQSLHAFEVTEVLCYRKVIHEGSPLYYDEDQEKRYSVTKLATGDYIVKDIETNNEFVMRLEYKSKVGVKI